MKKTIKELNIKNKKVIIRVDFNVPIKDGIIKDDTRIVESLKTINYAVNEGAKVILLSHLGRVKVAEDKCKTLKPVAQRLEQLIGKKVTFVSETRGHNVEETINNMVNGDIVLLENTRFEDLDNKKESKNDLELGQYWASLADIYINDAFGTSHRSHASNVGIASILESGIGFLIEKELQNFEKVINEPNRPYTIILGGAKISDKITLIENLVTKVDHILIGGGMAFTFLKALEFEIGNSLLDVESTDFCKTILNKYKDKIILPIDVKTENLENKFINDLNKDDKGLDIGSATIKLFNQYLTESKTIVWNGPVGMFEDENFSVGSVEICKTLLNLECLKIAGGGDTASCVKMYGYEEAFSHISTGGGASLELLEGKELPGIEVIK